MTGLFAPAGVRPDSHALSSNAVLVQVVVLKSSPVSKYFQKSVKRTSLVPDGSGVGVTVIEDVTEIVLLGERELVAAGLSDAVGVVWASATATHASRHQIDGFMTTR